MCIIEAHTDNQAEQTWRIPSCISKCTLLQDADINLKMYKIVHFKKIGSIYIVNYNSVIVIPIVTF